MKKVYTLEERNQLYRRVTELEEGLTKDSYLSLSFTEKCDYRDELMELKVQLGKARLWDGDTDDCENCGA